MAALCFGYLWVLSSCFMVLACYGSLCVGVGKTDSIEPLHYHPDLCVNPDGDTGMVLLVLSQASQGGSVC